jgi:hypothetical protein
VFNKIDVYIIVGTVFVSVVALLTLLIWYRRFPTVQTLTEISSLFNTKGGIIMVLWLAWWLTLFTTLSFGIWVIVKGVDPQHGVVITLLAMLSSQAFGNVNGALFKTMTGEDVKPPITTTVTQTTVPTEVKETPK